MNDLPFFNERNTPHTRGLIEYTSINSPTICD